MTQTIDPIKLKAAAEHLEWVFQQYPNELVVQGLYQALLPMIEAAKDQKVYATVDRGDIPGGYFFSDGAYRSFENPNIEDAYYEFVTEMEGGLTEQDERILAEIEAYQKINQSRGNHE
jgi:hypothetical protein